MTFDVINVNGLPGSATQLVDWGEAAVLINSDAVNSVMLDDRDTVSPGDIKPTLGPTQTISFNGDTAVWAIALTSQPVTMLKFPGGTQIGHPSAQSPTISSPMIAFGNVGSGNTTDLIGTVQNPGLKLAIQLLTCSISSLLAGVPSSGFNSQDVIQDDLSIPILGQQVGLPSAGGVIAPSLSQDMKNAVRGPGRKIQLANGGGGGPILHQCAATVVYYLIADPEFVG